MNISDLIRSAADTAGQQKMLDKEWAGLERWHVDQYRDGEFYITRFDRLNGEYESMPEVYPSRELAQVAANEWNDHEEELF